MSESQPTRASQSTAAESPARGRETTYAGPKPAAGAVSPPRLTVEVVGNLAVPYEGRSRDYLPNDRPVTVSRSTYYLRRIKEGALKEV